MVTHDSAHFMSATLPWRDMLAPYLLVQHKRAQRHSTAVSETLAYGVAGVAYLMSLDTFFVLTSCC